MRLGSSRLLNNLLAFSALLALGVIGCVGPSPRRSGLPEIKTAYETTESQKELSSQTPEANASASESKTTTISEDSLTLIPPDVMTDLKVIGESDPTEMERLLADQNKMKPTIWAGLVKQRRALLAYKQQAHRKTTEQTDSLPEGQENNRPAAAQASNSPTSPPTTGTSFRSNTSPPATSSPASTPSSAVDTRSRQQAPATSIRTASTQTASSPAQYDTPESRSALAHQYAQMQLNQQMQMSGNPLRGSGFPSSLTQSPGAMPGMPPLPGFSAAQGVVPAQYARPSQLANAPRTIGQTPQAQLEAAILAFEKQAEQSPASPETAKRLASLRLLYLAANRPNEAMRPLRGVSSADQDYWASQMFSLATYLDSQQIENQERRAAVAKRHLTTAAHKLGELGALTVNNLALCTKVTSYGVYDVFDPAEFSPGDEVLLYAEVDNFLSEPSEKGFHTSLKSSYQILDSRGEKVAEDEFPVVDDHCRQVRRDFFVRYFVRLPSNVPNGEYTLQLFVEDTKSNKLGQSSVVLRIEQGHTK